MTIPALQHAEQAPPRATGWLAIISGILGICSFASLIAYITSPGLQITDAGAVPPMGATLLTAQFLCSAAQVFMMVPVAIWLQRSHRLHLLQPRSSKRLRFVTALGVLALGAVGMLRLIAMADPAVSDILFMLPMGLVGVWLVGVNWEDPVKLPAWMRILGGIAGICLIGVGLNFVFNGGLAVFSEGPMAYGNDVNFHIGLGLFGFPGFTLFASWSILIGVRLLSSSIE